MSSSRRTTSSPRPRRPRTSASAPRRRREPAQTLALPALTLARLQEYARAFARRPSSAEWGQLLLRLADPRRSLALPAGFIVSSARELLARVRALSFLAPST